jgi:predicted RNA binding protein YcfA (HicA-like mRNA interferase family)
VLAVPIHGKKAIKRGTLRSLIRAAGLTRDEFLELLDG